MAGDDATASTAVDTPIAEQDEAARRPAWLRLATLLAGDVAIGVLLGVMIIVTLLFSSGVSKFVYIDF